MATYKLCKKCKKVSETKKVIRHEGGTEYIDFVCSECGHVESTNINHVHYGNDKYP